jgi:predicted DNA-binding ribbon-helix-helix protein
MMRYMEQRRRAPRREGHRTTLTLPHTLMEAAERLADELGTTANDAIVRLAEEGAQARERHAHIAAVAAERRAAVVRATASDVHGAPDPGELRAAMLGGRHTG